MAYVCICNPTTDKEIIKACQKVSSENELKVKLNICQNCKSCFEEINKIYNQNKK